ncbi:MAG: hypothetical protein ABSF64_27495 [Bryobacteraceae bacterium]|jgi:hypothetical protein
MAGISAAGGRTVLYDFKTRKQSEVSRPLSGYPTWSRDSASLFYVTFGDDLSWWRLRMRDRKTERVTALKNKRVFQWFATAPNNSLITTHNVVSHEIYALDWEAP